MNEEKKKTEKKDEMKQARKKYAERGTRGQKSMTFRADWDVLKILEKCENKGRVINNAVKDWGRRNRVWPDTEPSENDGHDYEK